MRYMKFLRLWSIVTFASIFFATSLAMMNLQQVAAQGPDARNHAAAHKIQSEAARRVQFADCEPITPDFGEAVTDSTDSITDTIDFIEVSSSLSGQILTADMTFFTLPMGPVPDESNPIWEVYIDTDDDPLTGFEAEDARQGSDYSITVFQAFTGTFFEDVLDVEVWKYGRTSWDIIEGTSSVSINGDIMTVSAPITAGRSVPGVSLNSRLVYWAEIYNPSTSEYEMDIVACSNADGSTEYTPIVNTTASIANAHLRVDAAADGSFVIGTTGGNLADPDDDNKRLTYGFDVDGSFAGTSFVSINIDDTDIISLPTVTPIQSSTENGQSIETIWQLVSDITLIQTLSFMENPFTGNEDLVRIEYQLTNNDIEAHDVGLRYLMDTMVGQNDDAPFFIPWVGDTNVEHTFPTFYPITDPVSPDDTILIDFVPEHYTVFESEVFAEDSLKTLGILDPQLLGDYLGDQLVAPNRFLNANWTDMFESDWDFVTFDDYPHQDSAISIYWGYQDIISPPPMTHPLYEHNRPITLAPAETKILATAYGLPGSDVGVDEDADWLEAPVAVTLVKEKSEIDIDITYWIYNNTDDDLYYDADIPIALSSDGLIVIEDGNTDERNAIQKPTRKKVSKKKAAGQRKKARYRRRGPRIGEDPIIDTTITFTLTYTFYRNPTFTDPIVFTETRTISIDDQGDPPKPANGEIYLPLIMQMPANQ